MTCAPHSRSSFGAAVGLALSILTLSGCHHSQRAAAPSIYANAAAPAVNEHSKHSVPPHAHPVLPSPPVPTDEKELPAHPTYTEVGLASWYGPPYHNRQAADGSIFDQNALTVAHRTLPMGTIVRVTNVATGESVIAKVTDRGPFIPGRTLDLSLAAAKAISVYRAGVAKVKIDEYVPVTADPEGRWCVQIGTFQTADDALQMKNDLLSRYAAVAKVIEFPGPTGFWVRINPLRADRTTASHIAGSIHLPDAEPYLVRLN
jgi:rare lipoprotein A